MHPALSILFFTTLSGAGYGLLAWLGISILLLGSRSNQLPALHGLQLLALMVGVVLSTLGLLSSLGHLGQPQRAWRALSQWRTSWLSREGVLALLTLVPALAIGAIVLWSKTLSWPVALVLSLSGGLLSLLSLATVACTAMIYASLKPIPAWRHPLVVPVYLVFALLTGVALLFVLMSFMLPGTEGGGTMLLTLAVLAALVVAAKWLYWYEIERAPLPATRGAAVGLPDRDVRVFEGPTTEANYITREMAFVLARTHAWRLKWLASGLILGLPLLAMLLFSSGLVAATTGLVLAALGTLAGAFVERWLFFAQAKHLVTLYY